MLRERFKHIPEFVDKMEASSGIKTRWHAPENWATSDVALPAAKLAVERAGQKPEDVDLIILWHRFAGLHHACNLGRAAV